MTPARHDLDAQDRERHRLFARSLRAARKRAHRTQVDVADALGVSEKAYAGYESARVWPSIGRFQRLSPVLGCPTGVLIGLREVEAGMAPAPPNEPPILRQLRWLLVNTRQDD